MKYPIAFKLTCPPPCDEKCLIDPGYVHSALMNIFDNAVDACLIDTSKADHQIEFSLHTDPNTIFMTVSDNGLGMDDETQSKLFTEFFSSKGRKGTGLGLYISNKIVEQHGGSIAVASAPQRGSKFTFKIPRQGI